MNQWNCKYCLRTIRIEQKDLHCQTARHKLKARWTKYYELYENLIKELDQYSRLHNLSFEEYEAKEYEIISELDRMLSSGVFDDQADEF